MITDPYRVLGIDRNATDEEIKTAYRKLSRKYHPDANVNAPNLDQIEETFKEIQQAYQQIQDEREHGSDYGSYGSYRQSGTGGWSVKMQAAANYINSRHFAEALRVLEDLDDRNGQWYFFSAVANAGIGNNIKAREMISQAVALEPDNYQFRQFQEQLEYGGSWYQTMNQSYETPSAGGGWCMNMCLLNLFCNCCRPC